MSMLVSFVLSFFPRDVLDEILNLIGSVSEGFPSYSYIIIYLRRACDFLRQSTIMTKIIYHHYFEKSIIAKIVEKLWLVGEWQSVFLGQLR